MYKEFNIINIYTSLKDKELILEFSFDVEEESVDKSSILLSNKDTEEIISFNIEIEKNILKLKFMDWPMPNSIYYLKVQNSVKSITGDELKMSLRRDIVFKSEVKSNIRIISPSDYEQLKELAIEWEEISEEDKVNNYYIEVARNIIFYDIARRTNVEGKNKIELKDISYGQYYLRVRAQKSENEYGRWSEPVTFVFGDENKNPGSILDQEKQEPIYDEDIHLIFKPEDGSSPDNFILEFNEEIDPDSIDEIVVLRRSF